MSWTETPPFDRGNSFVNGNTIDTVNDPYPGVNFEGKEYIFPDKQYGTGVPVKVRAVRNTTGGFVLPGRLYAYDPAYPRQRVNTATVLAGGRGWPADELLPAAGVQNNDLFFIVISGPCLVYTGATPGASNVIAVGDQVVPIAAATSGAPDAGAVGVGGLAASTAISNGFLGFAMSAATTGNTSTGLLIMMESRW